MKDVLHRRHRTALARFLSPPAGRPSGSRGRRRPAGPSVLLAFDYDGVLAPLVKEPSGAHMRPHTRELLARLSRRYPVAVVSGRAWKDVAAFVDGLVPTIVGNHGFEVGHPAQVPASVLRSVRGWRRQLERDLAGVEGLHFEDKRSTLAVHYGLSRAWRRAERAVYEAANKLQGTRLIPGKKVLNVLPHDFPSKGDAVRTLVAKLGCEGAVYVGDDVTDEDAFAVGAPLVFGVHVGKGPSLAPWRLAEQVDVDAFMELLLRVRDGKIISGALPRAVKGTGERRGSRMRLPRSKRGTGGRSFPAPPGKIVSRALPRYE
jgi:trehalose 6-phosphate phosphatase